MAMSERELELLEQRDTTALENLAAKEIRRQRQELADIGNSFYKASGVEGGEFDVAGGKWSPQDLMGAVRKQVHQVLKQELAKARLDADEWMGIAKRLVGVEKGRDEAQLNTDMAFNIFEEIREALDSMPCCHGPAGHDLQATPPMMFREWILCVVAKAEREHWKAEAEHIACLVGDKGAELEKAQAKCAEMTKAIEGLIFNNPKMPENEVARYVAHKAIENNPGQPLLDRLHRAEAKIAEWRGWANNNSEYKEPENQGRVFGHRECADELEQALAKEEPHA